MTNKILIKNIYYMLVYVLKIDKQPPEKVAREEFENLNDLFAIMLGTGISELLKRGLYREYINMQDDINTVRGKINMPETIKNKIAHKQIINCNFDEFSENNLLNRILKTTANLLIKSDAEEENKNLLKKEIWKFGNVDIIIDPKSIQWSQIHYHRNNQTYEMLINLCRFIIDNMLLATENGEYKLAKFISKYEMNTLYEKFILAYYKRHFSNLYPSASKIEWAVDDGNSEHLPEMQTDTMLSHKDKILIIDAKYYGETMDGQYDKKNISSKNLYQIFAYVKNKQRHDESKIVSGMLLYARTNEKIQPDNTYMMSGNRIDVKTLDLNTDFKEIKEQLNSIARDFFELPESRAV